MTQMVSPEDSNFAQFAWIFVGDSGILSMKGKHEDVEKLFFVTGKSLALPFLCISIT